MNPLTLVFSEAQDTFRLSLPLITHKLAIIFRVWLLTWMFAQLGINSLAAGGLALTIVTTLISFLIGLFTAVGTSLTKDENKKETILQNAFFLGMIFAIPATLLFLSIAPLLQLTGQLSIIANLTGNALEGFSIAIIPITMTFLIYQFFISQLKTRPIMIYSLLNTFLIITVAYFFIVHERQISGYGWAALFSSSVLLIILLIHFYCSEKLLLKGILTQNYLSLKEIKSLWKLGWPVGIKYGIEMAIFIVIALLISQFGAIALATQQIFLQLTYISGMTADAVGNVTMIKISQNFNQGNKAKLSRILVSSLTLITIILAVCFLVLTFLSGTILPLLIKPTEIHAVMQLIYHTVPWVILFFFFDSWRMVLTLAQIGLKDPLYPLITEVLCFWGIALPLGYFIAHHTLQNMSAYWISLGIGISLNIMLLGFRFNQQINRTGLTFTPGLI